MGFQRVSDWLRDSFPARDIDGVQRLVRTIRQTQEFGSIPASNKEEVSVPVVLWLGVQSLRSMRRLVQKLDIWYFRGTQNSRTSRSMS
jgi:hypothetical protein